MITSADGKEVQPDEFVTVKVNTPGSSPVIVLDVPVPVVPTSPGLLVIVHVPEDGNPLSTTLPVGMVKLGCVTVPTTGADGVGGCTRITTFDDATEIHPASLVTVKLYVPVASPVIIVIGPEPVVVTVPG